MSQRAVTNCSQGIGSWYCNKYLQKEVNDDDDGHKQLVLTKFNILKQSRTVPRGACNTPSTQMVVRLSFEVYLCAISRSSFVSTLASDVMPATLQAMSLQEMSTHKTMACQNNKYSNMLSDWRSRVCGSVHSLIELVDLLREEDLVKQLVDVASLCCQQHSIICQDPQTCSSMTDCFHGVLHLIQAPCSLQAKFFH